MQNVSKRYAKCFFARLNEYGGRTEWLAGPGAKIHILVFESASLNGRSIGSLQANECLIIFFCSCCFTLRKQINQTDSLVACESGYMNNCLSEIGFAFNSQFERSVTIHSIHQLSPIEQDSNTWPVIGSR